MEGPLNAHQAIDWPVVVEALAESAHTPAGAAAIRAGSPLAGRAAIEAAYDEVDEVLTLRRLNEEPPVGGVADVREAVTRASKGMVLDGPELLGAGRALGALGALAKSLDRNAETAPKLAIVASRIDVDTLLGRQLERSFGPTGELSAEEYPELGEQRTAIARLHEQVRETLEGLLRGEEFADLLQDRFWTVRENRYVLPIKSHAKRWDKGIVHDVSGSGHTVFVEPHAVIDVNNRLRLAEGQLRAAEQRILTQLSRELGTQRDSVETATEAAIHIDVACARATLAQRLCATRPKVGSEGVVALKQSRHPVLVLRGVEVVANDLEVAPRRPVLVLSGPNAGGKTVALKTIGLCVLLVAWGCFVPADEGSRVDHFSAIHASIGDEQTVEGDLSSFSAHLVGLRRMLDAAGPGQLVLLDEIASGTDPAQGAALARAVLEQLADAGCRVVVTTHFGPLKGLAAVDDRFAIAAVQYAHGRPTYRVIAGATGESHAFSIALKVGLKPELVERARALLGDGEADLAKTLERLELDRAELLDRLDALKLREAQVAADAAALAEQQDQIKRRSKALEAEAAERFVERLKAAERAIGQVVASLQRSPTHESVRATRATLDALSSLIPGSSEVAAAAPPPLSVGERVRHKRLGAVGEVVSVGDGGVQVRVGGVTVKARAEELERSTAAPDHTPRPRGGVAVERAPRPAELDAAIRHGGNTTDLRGLRVDEATDRADAFFDKALLSGQSVVFLLHGHGTGALKDALRGWLRSSSYVSDWAAASEEQGGDAFTAVLLG